MKHTQEEFDRLPALLERKVVYDWTGLGERELSAAARSGEIRTYPAWATPGHHKYFKSDIAYMCGMKAPKDAPDLAVQSRPKPPKAPEAVDGSAGKGRSVAP